MMAEAVARERFEIQVREKAQAKVRFIIKIERSLCCCQFERFEIQFDKSVHYGLKYSLFLTDF